MKVFYVLWLFSSYNGLAAMDHYDTLQECEAAKYVLTEKYSKMYPREYGDNGKNWFDKAINCFRVDLLEIKE